jgi:hypothetical protein
VIALLKFVCNDTIKQEFTSSLKILYDLVV